MLLPQLLFQGSGTTNDSRQEKGTKEKVALQLSTTAAQKFHNSIRPKLLSVGRLKLGDNRHFWVVYVLQFLIKSPYSACSFSLYGLDEQNEIIEGFKSNYKLSYPNF